MFIYNYAFVAWPTDQRTKYSYNRWSLIRGIFTIEIRLNINRLKLHPKKKTFLAFTPFVA